MVNTVAACFAESWESEPLADLLSPVTLFVKIKDGNRTSGLPEVSSYIIRVCCPCLHCVQIFIQLSGELGLTITKREKQFRKECVQLGSSFSSFWCYRKKIFSGVLCLGFAERLEEAIQRSSLSRVILFMLRAV
jgi:hypothetical protein